MRPYLLLLLSIAAGCSSDPPVGGDEADVTGDAKIAFTADFQTKVSGAPRAGKGLVVDYALSRLPQCRGNVGGGGPGWNITGYYSESGGPAKTFEVSALSADGKDRVTKPTRIPLASGGDLALWFQVTSRWGCSEFDSAFGQNFHVDVQGPEPQADARILFKKDGAVEQSGELRAGGKVEVRYEQARLPQCRRQQAGMPQWTITGFASLAGAPAATFQTGRPEGADRAEIDAILPLPRAGELALWFQVTSLGGCNAYDSKNGQNYTFRIAD
jgi:hypothetical protein